eukprot:CAMPEP_0175292842 /NCGR_PEP_ID=MMETSP0093-20121207/57154_1 /TAXON_ID=311494 /ORGANISM="Alexandrium monilatum, Strain CCMP3105" /LENGTH=49 /DNA_ID= /DNA_START= /DNA_END= /DNA_ORIENTATION=
MPGGNTGFYQAWDLSGGSFGTAGRARRDCDDVSEDGDLSNLAPAQMVLQ